MDRDRRYWQMGMAVIAAALTMRLLGGVWDPLIKIFSKPEVVSFLLFMETGRVVRLSDISVSETRPEETIPKETFPTETLPQIPPSMPEVPLAVFEEGESELVQVSNLCGYDPNLEQLLHRPLSWDLTAAEPAVLILHTHATESYTQTQQELYTESSLYRTLDPQHNMIRVGDRVAQVLAEYGIQAIHDRALHDHPSYTGSYNHARQATENYLEEHPGIRVILDIHRDALDLNGPEQLCTRAEVDGNPSAQIMMVVGTDAGGLYHPQWQENMAFAVKLHAQLEKRWPGICRPINFRTERFNQDLSPGALIIEVGANGNTLEEALIAAEALARGIADLAGGTVTAGSTSS